jgi:hypothetical protein
LSLCGASIASRSGLHSKCGLDDHHKGSCVPVELLQKTPSEIVKDVYADLSAISEWPEARFVTHLLAIVQCAGGVLDFVEARNVAVALLRTRLGLEVRT